MSNTTNPAETYESYMVPALFEPWAVRLLQLARPHTGEDVLDVACGTGIVSRRVAPRVGTRGRVVGLDISSSMLDVARTCADEEGLKIDWVEATAEALPFPEADFDLVVCQFGLMFFTDRHLALSEMRRVLRAGGRVALAVWQPLDQHPFYQRLHEVINRRLGMSAVEDIFALGNVDDLHTLVTGAGFRRVEIAQESMNARFPAPEAFLAGEIDVDTAAIPAMQYLSAAAREEITALIRDDMSEALAEVTVGEHVVMPFKAHLMMAFR
jgi:ubiquinone/menaquinone biosynthesis C-methylase UbiE